MRKIIKILILLLFISGCSSVKQGYRNFTAYYNTFYNTKQFYDAGLRLNQNQRSELNPNQAIRIHPSPSNGGLNEFQNAIGAGSSILRDHLDSNYLIPAIFIIGKSYYHRSEYFSALEKFQELEALSEGEDRQGAVLWQGLTYLEMLNYEGGIEFLESQMEVITNWDSEILAEIKAVLAQLNSQIGEHRTTVDYLEEAISLLENHEKKTRAFFLLGQSLESLDLFEQALIPYRAISGYRASFEIDYHSKKKEGELTRELGYYEQSERIFRLMSRDSKYLNYQNELWYEIARTQQLKGDYEEALISYNQVIEDRYQTPLPVTLAKTYYGIGEIYRDNLMDYTKAAEYFELSASERVEATLLPVDFNAVELAQSFGRYSELKSQILENDSLLVLANMSDEELKDFITEIQRLEQEKFDQNERDLRRGQDSAIMPTENDETIDIEIESEYGFLNSNNRNRQAEASFQFQSIWGDRPIADNWRRRDAVSGSRFEGLVIRGEEDEEIGLEQNSTVSTIRNVIELSHIPFSEQEQLSLRRETENLNYQMGNVFFLTLSMPDSAKVYYEKVIESGLDKNLVTMSMYSLAELELSMEDVSEANLWYNSLVEFNPESQYARQLATRLDRATDSDRVQEEYSTAMQYSQLMENEQESDPANRAERILEIAEMEESELLRARLYLDAAYEYMKAAQLQMASSELIPNWIQTMDRIESERVRFEQQQDSSRVMLADTTITESERDYWLTIQDLRFSEPNFTADFPYQGAYWDSTRSILGQLEENYSSSPLLTRVVALNEELQIPGEVERPILSDDEQIAQNLPIESVEETAQLEVIQSPPTQQTNEREEEEITPPEPQVITEAEEIVSAEPPVRADEEEIISTEPPVIAETEEVTSPESADTTENEFMASYTIVLHSFRNEQTARTSADELIQFGDTVFICPRVIDSSTYYRVSIGSFEEIVDAIQKSRILEEPFRTNYFISSTSSACEIIY